MKKLLFLFCFLFSFEASATDSRYLQCFESFPNKILVMEFEEGKDLLEKREITNYEKQIKGGGYGVYYKEYLDMLDFRLSMCQVSLFIYTDDPRKNPPAKKFSQQAMKQHLIDYGSLMMSQGNRKVKDVSAELGVATPDDGQFISSVGETQVKGHNILLMTAFFENSLERYALTEYKGHYLKALITCGSLDNVETDKNKMSVLTKRLFLTAFDFLDKCTMKGR